MVISGRHLHSTAEFHICIQLPSRNKIHTYIQKAPPFQQLEVPRELTVHRHLNRKSATIEHSPRFSAMRSALRPTALPSPRIRHVRRRYDDPRLAWAARLAGRSEGAGPYIRARQAARPSRGCCSGRPLIIVFLSFSATMRKFTVTDKHNSILKLVKATISFIFARFKIFGLF